MLARLAALLMSLRRVLQIGLVVPIVGGPVLIAILAFSPPLIIGVGKFEHVVHELEAFNFKWWLFGLALFGWLVPLGILLLWRRSQAAVIELNSLRDRVLEILEGRSIPVTVDINENIPVVFDSIMNVPVGLDTEVNIDHDVEIEATIPIQTELPLDTTVSTKVFGIGQVSIPIKAQLPLDFAVPIAGKLRIKASGIPISINEEARIQLPPIEVPLKCQLQTRIDLRRNIEATGLLDDHGLDEGSKSTS